MWFFLGGGGKKITPEVEGLSGCIVGGEPNM